MTRRDQKAAERQTLGLLLSVLGIAPELVDEGETPDFVLRLAGRPIGVEITTYQSGTAIEAARTHRQIESEWETLELAANAYRAAQPDLARMNVGLMFKDLVPPRKKHDAFIAEIAAFVCDRAGELGSQDKEFWPREFTSPLMTRYLRTLYARVDDHARWYSNITAGWVACPDATLAAIVTEKSTKKYRATDRLWLAVQCSSRISETMLPLAGAADFGAAPGLVAALHASPFDRAYFLAIGGIFQWERSSTFTNFAPPPPAVDQPSLDDLKGYLLDPEWLADPVGKADEVAREVLAEFRRKQQG